MRSFTRRDLIASLTYSGLSLSSGAALPTRSAAGQSSSYRDTTFLEIIRQPDSVTVFVGLGKPQSLNRSGARWETSEIRVRTEPGQHELPLSISAPGSRPTHIHVRWNIAVAANLLVL